MRLFCAPFNGVQNVPRFRCALHISDGIPCVWFRESSSLSAGLLSTRFTRRPPTDRVAFGFSTPVDRGRRLWVTFATMRVQQTCASHCNTSIAACCGSTALASKQFYPTSAFVVRVVTGIRLLSRCVSRSRVVIWLILPVVICLSQRLSHACLSISTCTVKLRMAH